METNRFYIPILKAKLGEFMALEKLEDPFKDHILPLFEITPMEWDFATKSKPRTMEEHLDRFCKKIEKMWRGQRCFIDTSLLKTDTADNSGAIDYVFEKLGENSRAIPCISVLGSKALLESFLKILSTWKKTAAIRFTIDDITDPEFEMKLVSILTRATLRASDCHIVFDLKDADFTRIDEFVDSIMGIIETFPYLKDWASFSIGGSAFVAASAIKQGAAKISRNDWNLYQRLIEKTFTEKYYRPINFGDYSIVAPGYSEFDPTKMSSSANIRYTSNDFWYVVKGTILKKKDDYKQYRNHATVITNKDFYDGENYCAGDAYIAKCARGEESTGSKTTWNWVGNNRHFTKVIDDLFAIHPEPSDSE